MYTHLCCLKLYYYCSFYRIHEYYPTVLTDVTIFTIADLTVYSFNYKDVEDVDKRIVQMLWTETVAAVQADKSITHRQCEWTKLYKRS